ncbi:unnamed protein product, partial [Brachionus calyciflorus]
FEIFELSELSELITNFSSPSTGHTMNYDNIEIIYKADTDMKLRFKELLHILKCKSSLNKQLNSQSNYEIKTLIIQAYPQNRKSSGFHTKIDRLINETKEVTIELEDAKNEIFKLFTQGEINNDEIEKKNEAVVEEFIQSNRESILCTCNKASGVSKITNEMFKYGISEKLVNNMKPCIMRALINFYKNLKIIVFVDGQFSNTMKITRGVKQGGRLSPFLFSIYIDELSGRLDKNEAGFIVGNIKINSILYADDLILICNNILEMNRMLEITENYGKEYEIKFNPNKTNDIHAVFQSEDQL